MPLLCASIKGNNQECFFNISEEWEPISYHNDVFKSKLRAIYMPINGEKKEISPWSVLWIRWIIMMKQFKIYIFIVDLCPLFFGIFLNLLMLTVNKSLLSLRRKVGIKYNTICKKSYANCKALSIECIF